MDLGPFSYRLNQLAKNLGQAEPAHFIRTITEQNWEQLQVQFKAVKASVEEITAGDKQAYKTQVEKIKKQYDFLWGLRLAAQNEDPASIETWLDEHEPRVFHLSQHEISVLNATRLYLQTREREDVTVFFSSMDELQLDTASSQDVDDPEQPLLQDQASSSHTTKPSETTGLWSWFGKRHREQSQRQETRQKAPPENAHQAEATGIPIPRESNKPLKEIVRRKASIDSLNGSQKKALRRFYKTKLAESLEAIKKGSQTLDKRRLQHYIQMIRTLSSNGVSGKPEPFRKLCDKLLNVLYHQDDETILKKFQSLIPDENSSVAAADSNADPWLEVYRARAESYKDIHDESNTIELARQLEEKKRFEEHIYSSEQSMLKLSGKDIHRRAVQDTSQSFVESYNSRQPPEQHLKLVETTLKKSGQNMRAFHVQFPVKITPNERTSLQGTIKEHLKHEH